MLEQNSSTTALVVAGIPILQDPHGRYNLNTLHQASGYGDAKSPKRWTRLSSTQALSRELKALKTQGPDLVLGLAVEQEPLLIVHGGDHPGTYAHELLAVEYAGWISPAFRLKVNQAFIDLRTGSLVPAEPSTVVDPDLQAIVALARYSQETRAIAHRADAKADVALFSQKWVTVRQYVYTYELTAQMPPALQALYRHYLTRLCRHRGIPFYERSSPVLGTENEYPETLIRDTLPRWLARRDAQLDSF